MDSIDSFIQEMLDSDEADTILRNIMVDMKKPPIPTLEKVLRGFDCETNLHGIKFNRENQTVEIIYRVVQNLYAPCTISYTRFTVLIEGLSYVYRQKKW